MSKIVKGVGRGLKKIGKGLKKTFKKLTKSTVGKILVGVVALHFGGVMLNAWGGGGFLGGASSGAGSGIAKAAAETGMHMRNLAFTGNKGIISSAMNAAKSVGNFLAPAVEGVKNFAMTPTGGATLMGAAQGAFTPNQEDLMRRQERARAADLARQNQNLNVANVNLGLSSLQPANQPTQSSPYVSTPSITRPTVRRPGLIGRRLS